MSKNSIDEEGNTKRAKTSAAILIAALAIFAAIVVLASNSLSWPLASSIQDFISPPRPTGPANSSLLVSAASYVPELYCTGSNNCQVLNSTIRLPIASAPVTIYAFGQQNQLRAVARNNTNSDGMQLFLLRPGVYQVTIMTAELGNLSTVVQTYTSNTTELDVSISERSYECTFFESTHSLSTNLITPWDTIYLNINAANPLIQNSNGSIYINFGRGSSSFLSSQPVQRYPIHILNQYTSTGGTLSISAQLTSDVANVTGTTNIFLLTYLVSYTTKEYPMLRNVTETLPFPGAFS